MMHHLTPYYHYSTELLRSALAAQQSAATSPTSPQSAVAAAQAAFNIESLLAPRPLLPTARPSAISQAAASYFPYLPSAAAAAAALNLPTQHDIMAAGV